MRGAFLIWARRSLYVLHFTAVKKSLQRDTFALSETARLFVALEQRSAEMPLALSFIGGTQRHERRLAFTLSGNHCHDTLGFRASTIGRGSFLFCVAVMTPRRFPPPWSFETAHVQRARRERVAEHARVF
jgi:hypothetical protein